MAGEYNGSSIRYLGVSGTGTTPYPSTGWSVLFQFRPDSTVTINTFAYIMGHGEPLAAGVQAVNALIHNTGGGKLRMIVDAVAGNVIDFSSSNSISVNQWNGGAIVWDGSSNKSKVWMNGTKTEVTTSSFGSVTPPVPVRVGYATHGGTREFNGQICHVAKFSRALTDEEGEMYTKHLMSPQFSPTNADWHAEMHRGGNLAFDLVGQATISEISMVYGPHAPTEYPVDNDDEIGAIISAVADGKGPQFSFA